MTQPPPSCLYSANAPFLEELYETWLADPLAVSDEWRAYFASLQDERSDARRDVRHSEVQDRMLAIAAASMGYRVHVYAPEAELPAGDVAAVVSRAAYDDNAALAAFASAVDVITLEFENVPVAAVRMLEARAKVRPGARALEIAQDRIAEKDFVTGLGGGAAPYRAVADLAGLEAAIAAIGRPGILKTRRMGYDGKGQVRIDAATSLGQAWAAIGGAPSIYEGLVGFEAEFSILLARGVDGCHVVYPAPSNVHKGGILASSTVPAGAPGVAIGDPASCPFRVAGYPALLPPVGTAPDAGPSIDPFDPPGRDSCDDPGSGCLSKIFDDPDPGTGCGFPGSPCPE